MQIWAGIGLIVLGMAIRLAAIWHLRECFTLKIMCPPRLVTGGIYKWVRHPTYLGSVLIFVGVTWLASNGWLALIIGLLCFQVAHERIEREEAALAYWFPRDYLPYAARTKMLIPFVY